MTGLRQYPKEVISRYSFIPGETNNVTIQYVISVLTPVFKKLSFKELQRIRLICRSWNYIISYSSPFAKNCEIVIRDDPDPILDVLIRSEFQIWTSFRFLTPLLDNSTSTQVEFWQNVGENITSLSLLVHSFTPVELLTTLLSCPNLTSLSFSCKNIYGSQLWRNKNGDLSRHKLAHTIRLVDDIPYMQDVGFLGNLKELKIFDSNNLPQGVLRDLLFLTLNTVSLTLYDNGMSSVPYWDPGDIIRFVALRPEVITKLEITGSNIYPEYVTALSNIKGLNLTSLHFRYAKITDGCLLLLFRKQKNLTEINLSFTPCSQRPFLHARCSFEKLKKLVLRGFSSNITSFAFLCRMSNLEELDLSASFSNTMNWELLIGCLLPIRLKRLKSLNLSLNMGLGVFPRANLFTSLVGCFSHVTFIDLSQNNFIKDSFVHDVWRHMKFLRVVFLECLNGMSTEGITGIRHSQMQSILFNGGLERLDPHLMRLQNSGGAYIGDSTGIEILSLANNTRLNDFVIKFGVADLENLQKLKLNGCTQITSKCLIDLVKCCTRLEYLDLTGTHIPDEWAHWAKKTNPNLSRILTDYNPDVSPAVSRRHDYQDSTFEPPPPLDDMMSDEDEVDILLSKQYDY